MTHEHNHEHECDCGHDHDEEYTMEDLAISAHNRIEALIELLIEKKVITESEYEKKIEELAERDFDEAEEEDEE